MAATTENGLPKELNRDQEIASKKRKLENGNAEHANGTAEHTNGHSNGGSNGHTSNSQNGDSTLGKIPVKPINMKNTLIRRQSSIA